MTKLSNRTYRDYLLLVSIGLIWGSQFFFIEIAIDTMPPLLIAGLRLLVGAISISLLLLFLPQESKQVESMSRSKTWLLYGLISFLEALLPAFLVPWGQQHSDSSMAAIIMATLPIFTILLAGLFLPEEKWTFGSIFSVIVGFIGIIILFGPQFQNNWQQNILGELAILGASFSFALSLVLIKFLPTPSPIRAVRKIFLISAIPLLSLACIWYQPWQAQYYSRNSVLAVIILGMFCSGVVYVLYLILVKRAGATFTSLNNYLVPLFGTFLGVVFLGESLEWNQVLALGVIFVAMLGGHGHTKKCN